MSFNDVLPLNIEAGDFVNFLSPINNTTFRKVIYFISNKKE